MEEVLESIGLDVRLSVRIFASGIVGLELEYFFRLGRSRMNGCLKKSLADIRSLGFFFKSEQISSDRPGDVPAGIVGFRTSVRS
jgi:hypothetical protein